MTHAQTCPRCNGHASVIVVDARAWCVHPYDKGGCGSFWQRTRGVWRLMRDDARGDL